MILTGAALIAYHRSISTSITSPTDTNNKVNNNNDDDDDCEIDIISNNRGDINNSIIDNNENLISDLKSNFIKVQQETLGLCFSPKEEEDFNSIMDQEPGTNETDLITSTSFRNDVRKEWIQAVFGDSLYDNDVGEQNKIGLANIAPYQSYSVDITKPTSDDEKLGLTISRLTLGLYVRKVQPGSEAACAGIIPNSVLVSINGLALLAEPSKYALERLWQYEGHFEQQSQQPDFIIQEPVELVLIHNGELYSVVLLSNPPYGIDWAPCGNFALVKRSYSFSSKVPVGAIVAQVGDVLIDELDHVQCAEELSALSSSSSKEKTVRIHLCFPPPETRSGYYERKNSTNGSTNASNNAADDASSCKDTTTSDAATLERIRKLKQRPNAVAEHDGVEVRVHSIWNSSYFSSDSNDQKSSTVGTLSKLAYRVASGEIYSLSQQQNRRRRRQEIVSSSSSNRIIRPCPSLPSPLLKIWTMEQALLYLLQYHDSGYDERVLRVQHLHEKQQQQQQEVIVSYLKQIQNKNNDTIDAFLLHILNFFCQNATASRPLNYSQSLLTILLGENNDGYDSKIDSKTTFRMELLAHALDLTDLKRDLRLRREQLVEEVERELLPTVSMDSSIVSENPPQSHVSSTITTTSTNITMTMTTPALPPIAPSTKKSSKKLFSFFRKRKTRKKLAAITNTDKNSNNNNRSTHSHSHSHSRSHAKHERSILTDKEIAPAECSPSQSKADDILLETPPSSPSQKSKERPILLSPVKPNCLFSQNDMFSNTLLFLEELQKVCSDIEKLLLKSFSQKIASWALQPWSASKESALAQVTTGMRERLSLYQQLPLLNPIDSGILSALDTEGCYILPSAHFPLLLTFEQQPENQDIFSPPQKSKSKSEVTSSVFGSEKLYRTTVELVQISCGDVTCVNDQPEEGHHQSGRRFLLHGSVGGQVMETSRSSRTSSNPNIHSWDTGNVLIFDCRSSWGPPQTLSLSLSEVSVDDDGQDQIVSNDGNGTLSYQRHLGFCWIDLASDWENESASKPPENNSETRIVPVWNPFDFDEHGDVEIGSLEHPDRLKVEIRVTTELVDSPSFRAKRSVLYKHDDDVRQEMVATEFVKSCDNILKSSGLDLHLLSFKSIPVGNQRGFIEWVPGSVPLSEICQGPFSRGGSSGLLGGRRNGSGAPPPVGDNNNGNNEDKKNIDKDPLSSVAKAGLFKYESLYRVASGDGKRDGSPASQNPIQDYLRSFAFDSNDPYMIRKAVMERYVKSCAGYCAITYILGVGDRHLDNLLLHPTGHFFHCDFSFILGNDPKKYQPLRMTQDMINGMGGPESDNFAMFMSSTCAAYLTFRRPENVRHLLSFVRAMEGCGLPYDEAKKSMEDCILDMRERLRLDLSEDEAISYMEKLVQESCSSKMWMAVDAMHSLGKRF